MRQSLTVLPLPLLLLLATAWAGEYCEDFENGDLGDFWRQSPLDIGGKWEPSSYTELKETIPDFPEPASGDTVVYLTPENANARGGSTFVSARLVMSDAYIYPAGSSIYFRYWLRSDSEQSGTLELQHMVGAMEQPEVLYSLTDQSGPDVDTWKEINITIPEGNEAYKLAIFAYSSLEQESNIAIDDITVYGPTGLSRACGAAPATSTSGATSAPAGAYCEEFENGDLGHFWTDNSLDYDSKWEPSSYQELKETILDFPEPASGDTVLYLTPRDGTTTYVSARLVTKEAYIFPEGSSIYFRYWLRSKYVASGTLELRRVNGTMEEPNAIHSLTEQSGPDVHTWREVNITIPTTTEYFKLLIFAACSSEPENNIAIDDITVYGPTGLSQACMN